MGRLTDHLEDSIDEIEELKRDDPETLRAYAANERDLERVKKLKDLLSDIEAMEPGVSASGIDAFFRSVGEGVIEAQRKLDRESADYIDSDPLLPSMFRIPKAEAEFSFSLSKVSSNRMGLVILSSKEKRDESQTQKVSFEVVSAPPPPEAVEGIGRMNHVFVENQVVRYELKERLEAMKQEATGHLLAQIQTFADARTFRSVLVLREDDRFVLVRAKRQDEAKVDFDAISFRRRADGTIEHEPQPAGNPGTTVNAPPRLKILAGLLADLGEEQEKRIDAARRNRRTFV